eukprot:NODE_1029_length_1938_cov_0.081566.p2 type:complete len:283 gc:universal NODE_1029_length_1938_cov_0.081566:1756-908(-)
MPVILEEFKDHLELDFDRADLLKVGPDYINLDDYVYNTKLLNLDSSNLTAVKGGLRLVVFYQPILMKPKHVKRNRVTNISSVHCSLCNHLICDTSELQTTVKPWDGWYESLSECFCHKTKWTNPALSNEDLVLRNKILLSDFDVWIPGLQVENCPNCNSELGKVKSGFSMLWKWKLNFVNSLNYTLSECVAEFLHSSSLRGDFIVYMASHSKCCAIQILNAFTTINTQRCIKFMTYSINSDEIHLPLTEDLYSQVLHIFKLHTLMLPIDKRADGKISFLYLK